MSTGVESNNSANVSGTGVPAHVMLNNADPRIISWERLELSRLNKLRLGPKRFSRHFQKFSNEPLHNKVTASCDAAPIVSSQTKTHFLLGPTADVKKIAPLSTVGKPTCGFFFSRDTDNKKRNIGIPPANLVKWRSFVPQ